MFARQAVLCDLNSLSVSCLAEKLYSFLPMQELETQN